MKHRSYVGPKFEYDLMGGRQFILLFNLGLREDHKLLDFGCGSLRAGRLFIPYLLPGNYYGIEPHKWLIDAAIKDEIGNDIIEIKKPHFKYNDDFLNSFKIKFDFIIAQSIFSHTTFPLFKKSIFNLYESLKTNGLLCFTMSIDLISKKEINTETEEKWTYPETSTFYLNDILEFTNKIGYCTDIEGYHSSQRWFIMSNSKEKIDLIIENKTNLIDLPLKEKTLWKNSKLKFRKFNNIVI